MKTPAILILFLLSLKVADWATIALQQSPQQQHHGLLDNRRTFLTSTVATAAAAAAAAATGLASSSFVVPPAHSAMDLSFSTSASGIQWADAKVGGGAPKQIGDNVAIDYVMSTTGARYGSKIYSTADLNAPYRWTLGDGTTIKGLEEAIMGGNGIQPMMPGGIRRVIIPSSLAFESLAKTVDGLQVENCKEGSGVGPIPPPSTAFEEFQRFKNIYCNSNRPYQPDLVMDIKLYGRKATTGK